MNDDDDLVLNAKAIGLAIGGAALAGMLFVLTRRDERPTPALESAAAESAADSFAEAARNAADEARAHRESVEGKVKDTAASKHIDIEELERELKAAAWDAQERARIAESKLRALSSRVTEDASHLASRVGEEARHLAGEGKGRISHLRRHGEASVEIESLKDDVSARREEIAGKGKKGGKKRMSAKAKLGGKKFGPLPEGIAGEAASAALENLEQSLKSKAPLLLAARNKTHAMEIAQREIVPILRDSALLALSTALSGAERASQKAATAPQEIKQRLRHEVESADLVDTGEVEDKLRAARDAATAELLKAREEAEAEARAAREELERLKEELAAKLEEIRQATSKNGSEAVWARHDESAEPTDEPEAATEDGTASDGEHKRGISGLLWGGAGLGLAIYALMNPERRESILKFANEASIQLQELMRDLQGYDDEF